MAVFIIKTKTAQESKELFNGEEEGVSHFVREWVSALKVFMQSKTNKKCLVGLLLVILLGWCPIIPVITLIVSLTGVKRILPYQSNKWMGVLGVVFSIVCIIIHLLIIVWLASIVMNVGRAIDEYSVDESLEIVSEVETEAEVQVETAPEVVTDDDFNRLSSPGTSKDPEDTLPEIGEYETYGYWGAFGKGTYNGY